MTGEATLAAPDPALYAAMGLGGLSVLVTGGTAGIGRDTVAFLAGCGMRVALVGTNAARGEAVADEFSGAGAEVVFHRADVRDGAQMNRVVRRVADHFGGLDCAFNNAGVAGDGSVADADEAVFDEVFAVNCRGLWLSMRAELTVLRESGGGCIVNNLSVHSFRVVFPGVAPYVASKFAAAALTRSAALECAPDGIRVNGVAPGPIDTEMYRKSRTILGEANPWPALLPTGRVGTTQDVAAAVAWLFSPASSYVTGQIIGVDGGFLAV